MQRWGHQRIARGLVGGIVTGLAVLALAAPALASSPHFVSASASVKDATLTVSFKEAGLGGNELVTIEVSADATAVWGCINGGGKHPKATNKETVEAAVSNSGQFESGQNGQVRGSLSVDAPGPGDFTCPSGQNLRLLSATFTNIVVTDLTNGTSISIA